MPAAELLTFSIANYRSFYTTQTLDFSSGESTPRTLTVLYGPNSSGKSNCMFALQDFRSCIVNSANASWRLPYVPFALRQGAVGEPTEFSARFLFDGKEHEYSFSFVAGHVTSEELRVESKQTGRMNLVFRRDENGMASKSGLKHGFGKSLMDKTRPETLLITKSREDNNAYARAVFSLVEETPVVLEQGLDRSPAYVEILKRNEDLRARILKLLKNCDFAIRDIAIGEVKVPEEAYASLPLPSEVRQSIAQNGATTFSTLHAIRDDELSVVGYGALDFWSQESSGTRKFFEMAVPIVDALDKGHTLFIDEFGTYLHPTLAKALVGLFAGPENKKGARLVVNTQGTELMGEVAKRDDIILVEKNMAEESRVTPLKDRGARTTEPLESRYLRGLYGAVPVVRDR